MTAATQAAGANRPSLLTGRCRADLRLIVDGSVAPAGARSAQSSAYLTGSSNGSSHKHDYKNNQQNQTYTAANIHF